MNYHYHLSMLRLRHRVAKMSLTAGLILGLNVAVCAQNVTFKASRTTLKSALQQVEQQSDYKFSYSTNKVNVDQSIELPTSTNVEDLLKHLSNYGIESEVVGKQIVLTKKTTKNSDTAVISQSDSKRERTVTGTVVDENNEPIIGASVWIKGTTIGVATDLDGNFSLNINNPDQVIVISFIGYDNFEQLVGAKNKFDVQLRQSSTMIEEVIVTGYQTISKERATGSFAIVSPKEMEGKLQTNIIDRMEGMVAGLSSNRGQLQIRGVSTLNGDKNPLYVVDGVPFEGSDNVSPLEVINPNEIVNVTILKDATAASIYGARSANGVIVITTKGGQKGATRVNYNGSVNFQGLPDRDYANLMSSSELIDYQLSLFELYPNISRKTERYYQNPIQTLFLDLKDGNIEQPAFDSAVDSYRDLDRYDQVVEEFLRKRRVTQQHNVSFSGGSDVYKYSISANYTGTAPYEREQMKNRIGFNFKNRFDFFKWLSVDAGIMGSNVSEDYDNGVLGMSMLDRGPASYFMLRDDKGNAVQWYDEKSQFEIDRLNSLGLQDETYRPAESMANRHYTARNRYLNLNLGANLKINHKLSFDLRYQTENTVGYSKQYDTKNDITVKEMINDATYWDSKDQKWKNAIAPGGQMVQKNTERQSYTLRAQVNYSDVFNEDHSLQVLAGAEQRKVIEQSSGMYRVGYDDQSLVFSPIDKLMLSQRLYNTQAVSGGFSFSDKTPDFEYVDNRYVSFYGNASYTYQERLTLTGSIRIDQSNLFGTDPKYQYKPLWSLGAHYVLMKHRGLIDRLVVRGTYGLNGNVSKKTGPYLIAAADRNNYYTNESAFYIQSPPNPELRWEKTQVTNVGFDFTVANNRVNGSFDFYNKNTTDLLGNFATDPTLGWSSTLINFGSMVNRGVELSLNSKVLDSRLINWDATFVFGYNKNEITEVQSSSESASSYYSGPNIREGYAMNSLFSVRYAGLDENGVPMAYKQDGSIVKSADQLEKEDLVYSGTYDPPYNASLTNRFSVGAFDFSFMFIYAGGHVMRDVRAGMVLTQHPIYQVANKDKEILNMWMSPEDSDKDVNPAFMFQQPGQVAANIWKAADKHIQKGHYIKLRDVSLGYNLPERIFRSTPIKSVRMNMQARNLWWWAKNESKLDPEVWSGNNLSPTRGTLYPAEFTFGLSVGF